MNIEDLLRKEVKSIKAYVPSQSIDDVKKNSGISKIINLANNESVLGPSDMVKESLKSELEDIHRYPDSSSYRLREILSNRYDVSTDMIIITNGGDELINLLGTCFVANEDELIMGEYGFSTYRSVAELFGGKIVTVPFRNWHLDLEKIAEKVTEKTKLIFLCNPHNPNGTIFTQKQLEDFLKIIPDHPIIVLDEAYCDFVENDDFPDSISLVKENSHHIIALRTFSKIGGMAGLRVGFGIADRDMINCLKRIQPPYSVNFLAQTAARAFLSDYDYRKRLIQNNSQGKKFLYEEFDRLNLEYIPTEANFIFINLKKDADIICNELLKKGIIIRSGKVWEKNTWVRVTIGTLYQNQQLISAIKEVLVLLNR
ncbi:MAG: histidinol-phosphate transaminase [Atribacterota bacterium]|nr:histidinol-phosphate transaminase [Atribacterota bacterium]